MKALIHNAVEETLTELPLTRNSDKLLINVVMQKLGYYTFADACKKDAPSLESITRARRAIQKENPKLRAVKGVEIERYNTQMKFYEYARYGITED